MSIILNPGIDTPQQGYLCIVQINVLVKEQNDLELFLESLKDLLGKVKYDEQSQENYLSISGENHTVIIGFSARFFKGPLNNYRDELTKPNRWNLDCPVPPCLKGMQLRYDSKFKEVATHFELTKHETDLIVLIESKNYQVVKTISSNLQDFVSQNCATCTAIHFGKNDQVIPPLLGVEDGISNMQDLIKFKPDEYRSHIYCTSKQAGHSFYKNGTYLVFRKYIVNDEVWWDDNFSVSNCGGISFRGNDARSIALGRSIESQQVIHHSNRSHISRQFDSSENELAPIESHIRQANPRGHGYTSFGAKINVPDYRILRRSYQFSEKKDGKLVKGLLFLCFQSDIQTSGFELIHNDWLMSKFCGTCDPILDPARGLVHPVGGAYFFIPPMHKFPGDVFLKKFFEA